jgi:hypothetical protein
MSSMPARLMGARRKSLKPHHRLDDSFDGAVILLDDVTQYLFYRSLIGVERFERGPVGAALVHGNHLGLAVLVNGLFVEQRIVVTESEVISSTPGFAYCSDNSGVDQWKLSPQEARAWLSS